MIGTSLGPYKIIEQLGAGGMWTGPTLVGTRVHIRNHDQIKALDLSAAPNAVR